MSDDWKTQLLKKCLELKIEPAMMSETKITFLCPHIPPGKEKQSLISILPENIDTEFVEGPKETTIIQLQFYAIKMGARGIQPVSKDHHLVVTLIPGHDAIEATDPAWAETSEVIQKDGYYDSWEIICGEIHLTYNLKMIEEAKRRPVRDLSISKDDILNLKIALGASQDVNDFIRSL
jgi:hypothetical protein